MTPKRALITGITGQDGSYLAELLCARGYIVFGFARRSSRDVPAYIEALRLNGSLTLLHGDLRDRDAIDHALQIAQPDEIYNLASQSHVGISFDCAEETWATNFTAAKMLIETAIARLPQVRIYQASSSEMFGDVPAPQTETSSCHPTNPYGEAKLKAYTDCVVQLRETTGAFICSGILYNHESPRRGKNFVTRKITHSMAKIKLGLQERLEVGNIDAERDWGYAPDYVETMWRMLARDTPEDFVIATGTLHSVKDFIHASATHAGIILNWTGTGQDQQAVDEHGVVRVAINPQFYRPTDHLHNLVGDTSKARSILNWQPTVNFTELVALMTDYDLQHTYTS